MNLTQADHRWHKINSIFFAALDIGPEQRDILLTRLCGNDQSLRQEVTSLLSASDSAADFLQKPASDLYPCFKKDCEGEPLEGKRFGAYRVLRKIEHGGMGEVYLAERDDNHYRKQVAIKIIRRGQINEIALQDFCTERQILADLDHPYIARLLDGGTTEDGLPYLVMEHVAGERVDKHCDSHNLECAERLQLFLKVCSAVQCAHQGQVVHRDLKPANILVTAEGIPKLLDFGVARLLSNPSLYAEQSRLCFITPEYASPEQIRGDDVSVAADVYSLGILLYELLNGHHPYKTANHFLHEIPQAVCRSEPEKPGIGSPGSTTVSDSEAKPASFKSMRIWPLRGARPEQRHLADDLDTIILKAIHRVPEGRYSSVEQFSSDIYRCLAGMPVLARKNTLTYRGLKFAYRNKRLIMVIILALTGLLATHFGIRWEMNKEKSQLRANVLHRLNEILEAHDEERGLVVNTSDVIFNPGYVSLNADARERLARIAGIVLANPKLKLDVEGHTDSHGDAVYNLVISQERAQAVKAYLMTQGIPPEMVMAKGLGGMHPIASNNTETGRRRNRRVEIILSGDMIGTRIADATKSPAFTLVDTSAPSIALLSSIQNPTSGANIALNKKVIGSIQCNANEGPEKAVNGGREDKWCSHANPAFLQVDLGGNFSINQFIVRHAGAGGEPPVLNTRDFNIETSTDGHTFVNVVNVTHNTRNVTIHPVPAIMARFVRLNVRIPAQHGDHSSRIYELEVY